MSLRDIKRLLRTDHRDLARVLGAQRTVLEEKRRRLDLAIAAVREAQELLVQQQDAGGVTRIIEVIKMQDQRSEWKKQYDALLQGKIERLQAMSPEARQQLRGQFSELSKEIHGVLDEDPAGPRAQELAGRWLQLLGAFSPKGDVDPQLLKYAAAYLSDGSMASGCANAGTAVWQSHLGVHVEERWLRAWRRPRRTRVDWRLFVRVLCGDRRGGN